MSASQFRKSCAAPISETRSRFRASGFFCTARPYRKFDIDSQPSHYKNYRKKAMAIWQFRCYDTSNSGRKGFHEWYDNLPTAIAAEVDRSLEVLANTREWGRPLYDVLHGKCAGLEEIRIDLPADDEAPPISYRILGYSNRKKKEFFLLSGFEKINGDEYAQACPAALNRKKGVLRHGHKSPVCDFP